MTALPLADIPTGDDVLLDANVLIYALSGASAQCVELLRRCDVEEVFGFVTVEAVNEVCHRLMVAEAFGKGLIATPGVRSLKGKRSVIAGLSDYWVQTGRLLDSNLLVLDLDVARLRRAQRLRAAHGLLTTDATILAAAVELGIGRFASNDADFTGVPVVVHAPTDLP